MYKNWYQKKKRAEEESKERKIKIYKTMSSWTEEEWEKFRTAEFDIVLEPNKEAEERMNCEEEKIDQIIDGSFWNLENADFDELSDEEVGKRGRELLQRLKPFYRKNLLKPFQVEPTRINLDLELKENLKYDERLYRFEPDSRYGEIKLIDEELEDIWYKPNWDQAVENMRKADERGLLKDVLFTAASKMGRVSLRELYEQRVADGLDYKELEELARSNDALDQVLFLYVVKRAQRQDEIAARVIYKMYEDAVIKKAEFWIKRIEERRGIKFKQDGELGRENIKQISKVFLNMLITGDDPEAIFEQIKNLNNPRNIETYFTRKLGSKLRTLIKDFSNGLKEKAKEYNEFKKLEGVVEHLLDLGLSRFDKQEVDEFMKKIDAARFISSNPKKKRRTSYREFINSDKLNDRVKQLNEKYCEAEDFLISHKMEGYPSLYDKRFNEFTDEEKSSFKKILEEADHKASANEYEKWYTYREFLDQENFTENEKQMFEICKSFEDFLNTEYYPRLRMIRLEIMTLSNPYNWFSAADWFNDKKFKATKNKNFTNWLLGGYKSNGAFINLMNNWIRSSYFMKDTGKGLFKNEFIEIHYKEEPDMPGYIFNTDEEEIDEMIAEKIDDYRSKYSIKKRSLKIIEDCFREKLKLNELTYDEIADSYGISKRQVIRIWKKFEAWMNIN